MQAAFSAHSRANHLHDILLQAACPALRCRWLASSEAGAPCIECKPDPHLHALLLHAPADSAAVLHHLVHSINDLLGQSQPCSRETGSGFQDCNAIQGQCPQAAGLKESAPMRWAKASQ